MEGKQLDQTAEPYPRLVQAGLRAQLALQSFVTGQLRVDLDFRPDTAAQLIGALPDIPEIPTVPSELGQLRNQLASLPLMSWPTLRKQRSHRLGRLSDHLDADLDPLLDSGQRAADAAGRDPADGG